jgi:tetratricopeptide (TPR) repeat protein
LVLTPIRSDIWVQLGHAEKESGDLAQAAEAYSRAVLIAPHIADTHLQIGHLRKRQGDLDAAAESYAKAFLIDPALSHAAAELLAMGRAPPKTDAERIADLEAGALAARELAAQEAHKLTTLMTDIRAELSQLAGRVETLAEQSSVAAEFGVELSSTRSTLGKAFERLAAAEHALASLREETQASPTRSAA